MFMTDTGKVFCMTTKNNLSTRWTILAVGVFTMLFAGIIYAWSILKVPFA